MKKAPFNGLKYKAAAIVATTLCMLNHEANASISLDTNNPITRFFTKKKRKPKLMLKLNMYDPSKSPLVDHSSHSSHESHASHSSHSSGGYDGGGSDDDSGSNVPAILLVGGAVGYGVYRYAKKKNENKSGGKS